jgi:hypothetical protein
VLKITSPADIIRAVDLREQEMANLVQEEVPKMVAKCIDSIKTRSFSRNDQWYISNRTYCLFWNRKEYCLDCTYTFINPPISAIFYERIIVASLQKAIKEDAILSQFKVSIRTDISGANIGNGCQWLRAHLYFRTEVISKS